MDHVSVPADHSTDFGGLHRAMPSEVVHGGGAEGFRRTLRTARQRGLPVAIRGAGHSIDGQTLCRGVVFANQESPLEPTLLADGRAQLPSGMTWRAAEHWLNARGRSVPVLTDNLDVTVGGTLSAGGVGVQSIRRGLQIDHVERLRLIDSAGTAITCSPTQDRELFRFALGGLGQAGYIETAVMRTVPHQPVAHIRTLRHSSLPELVAFARQAADDPAVHVYNGYWAHGDIVSEIGAAAPATPLVPHPAAEPAVIPDHAFALDGRRSRWTGHFPDHHPLWADYILDPTRIAAFAHRLDILSRVPPLATSLKALYLCAIRRPADALPFAFAPALPGSDLCFGIGVYAMVDKADTRLRTQTRAALRALLELCIASAGRPYLYGVHDIDPQLAHHCYGDALNQLDSIRNRHSTPETPPRPRLHGPAWMTTSGHDHSPHPDQ